MKTLLCAALIGISAVPCVAQKIHDPDWKMGVLVDVRSEKNSRLIGVASPTGAVLVQKRNDAVYYEVDGGDIVYVAKQTLRRRWSKPLNVTVNKPLKFMVKGRDLYLLDEDGKKQKLSLEKKTLKPQPPPPASNL